MHFRQMDCVLPCTTSSVPGSVEGFSIRGSIKVAISFSRNITHCAFTDLDLFFVY